jgi:hypothetical protein
MRKTIDTIFENRVSLSKQASKLLYAKIQGLEVYISRTFNLIKKWGDRYLISSRFGDVLC